MAFSTAAHISVCAPWWWEGWAGQWIVLILQSNYNNIPHADGCVLPALPFYLWLSVQQVQVFSYLATVVMGHGFGGGENEESAVNSSVVAAATRSSRERRTHGPGLCSTHKENRSASHPVHILCSCLRNKWKSIGQVGQVFCLFSEQMNFLK